MSPSWIDAASRLRALGAPRLAAGVVCGRRHVGAALLAAGAHGWRVEALAEVPLAFELYRGAATQEATEGLAEALRQVCASFRNRHMPLHVALPDAAGAAAVFELDALPASKGARGDLARWRLGRESGGADLVCASQALGSDRGRHLLLALGIERGWRDCIDAALHLAGLRATSLRGNALRLFNGHREQIAGAALVALAPESWTLLISDGQARLRFLRSWWRAGERNELEEITEEARRVILAYVHGGPERAVGRVFVGGAPESSVEQLTENLDRRLREACVRLSAPEAQGFREAIANAPQTGALAFAAAIDA